MSLPLPPIVRRVTEEALTLADLLAVAQDAQWKASPAPKPREDTTERSKGGHSDPTPQIALDERRLALRAAVLTAEVALEAAVETLTKERRALEVSLNKWSGS